MSSELSQKFRESLINYLKNPNDANSKKSLADSAFAIYEDAVIKHGLEPDKYFAHMEEIVEPAVRGIKIHPHLGKVLDSFNRELSWSDFKQENQAFHVLTLAYNEHLKKNLINPEKTARDKLISIETIVTQLKIEKNPYSAELESALVKLKMLVEQHFKLSPAIQFQKHAEFERKLGHVCSEHRDAIESNAKIASAFYSFLAVVSSIFNLIGVSLSDKYQKKSMFFQEASLVSQNTLSDFNVPIEDKDNNGHDESNAPTSV